MNNLNNSKEGTNNSRENALPKLSKAKRYFSLSVLLCVALILQLIKIAYVQFFQGSSLKEAATKQQTTSRIISAKRGTIYDSTGTALAISADVDTITINPDKFRKKTDDDTKKNQEKVATGLSQIFELDYDETLKKVTSKNTVETIIQKVEKNKVTELKKWMEDNNVSSGINIDEDTKRYYPYYNLASNLLGFCGSDNQGLTGLEYYWEQALSGTSGKITTTQDSHQDLMPNQDAQYFAAQNGSNLTLTIDINIQSIAEKYLEQACITNKCGNGGNVLLWIQIMQIFLLWLLTLITI